ncbi:gluconokinase [Prosthecomicrobium pneumaticum]|uniref:Gluconokinase n=1 Tax=Prosthecomicrobium pneumaticum TaxID=81895 RepID=A0A7W9FNX2_9HYPH|nr:gluconokinase [Prosthecomicrobium pneumaticum]MBB5754139.1 carbohydrate kinase (thermoresistant glucokinase family) [Prosthecomicrobium pneumaticum]
MADQGETRACRVVVMGVSGSGKSTVGEALGAAAGVAFVDGDGLHPDANVAKMSAGIPLTDADRWPWLDIVAATLADHPQGAVVACSALRKVYRDRIRAGAPGVRFVFLDGGQDVIGGRQASRKGHFMPPSLLASQFATLERPGADEPDVVRVSVDQPVEAVVAAAVEGLGLAALTRP